MTEARNLSDAALLTGEAKIEEIDPETDEVVSTETEKNVIVDTAGSETIANYITGGTPTDFTYMIIGIGDTTAPVEGDTDLSTRTDTSPSLSATQVTTGGVSKQVQWSHTFASGTGKTSIVEMGMFDGTATDAGMLNRLTFAAKDNANNDLKITYTLTVS